MCHSTQFRMQSYISKQSKLYTDDYGLLSISLIQPVLLRSLNFGL